MTPELEHIDLPCALVAPNTTEHRCAPPAREVLAVNAWVQLPPLVCARADCRVAWSSRVMQDVTEFLEIEDATGHTLAWSRAALGDEHSSTGVAARTMLGDRPALTTYAQHIASHRVGLTLHTGALVAGRVRVRAQWCRDLFKLVRAQTREAGEWRSTPLHASMLVDWPVLALPHISVAVHRAAAAPNAACSPFECCSL